VIQYRAIQTNNYFDWILLGVFRKMKKTIILGLIIATLLSCMPINVYAVGKASINFKSSNTVLVGDTIKVYMSIEDIEDANNGIVGVGGKLIFDNEKLEFVEAKTIDTPYDFWFNPKSNKLAGLDFTFENAINKDTKIYEFTFKALDEGTTNVTLDGVELADSETNVLNVNVYSEDITIVQKEEVVIKEEKVVYEPVVKNEVVKTEVKEEITNKEKLEKVNNAVHNLLKKLTDLF